MSCTIVLPFSIFDSVLWDDNLLQSVPLLPHQDSKVILQNVNGKHISRDLFSSMENVKDVNGFWNFTENDLLDGLYSEEWYNQGTHYPRKS